MKSTSKRRSAATSGKASEKSSWADGRSRYYKNINATRSTRILTWHEVVAIRDVGLAELEEAYQLGQKIRTERDEAKKKTLWSQLKTLKETRLPIITTSVVCDSKGRGKQNVKEYNGIIQIDFDHINDPAKIEVTIKDLRSDPHTCIADPSPSGLGVKAFFHGQLTNGSWREMEAQHKRNFLAPVILATRLTGYGLKATEDATGIDPCGEKLVQPLFLWKTLDGWVNKKALMLPVDELLNSTEEPKPPPDMHEPEPNAAKGEEDRLRTIAELVFVDVGPWEQDENERTFARVKCYRGHEAFLYRNRNGILRLHCEHQKCKGTEPAINEHLEKLCREKGTDIYTVCSAGELVNMPVDPHNSMIGDGLLIKGGSFLLLGPSGIGKSRLLLHLAAACYTGKPFFGIPTDAKGIRWLIFQTENNIKTIAGGFLCLG
jgi:hypothetical protein